MRKNRPLVLFFVISIFVAFAEASATTVCSWPVDDLSGYGCIPGPCTYRVLITGTYSEAINTLPFSIAPPVDACTGTTITAGGTSFNLMQSLQLPFATGGSWNYAGPASFAAKPSWVMSVADSNTIPTSLTINYTKWVPMTNPTPPQDCVGNWLACDASGNQTYAITVPQAAGGLTCPFANGATQGCSANCIGSFGACAGGVQTYTISTPATGAGAACPYANGDTQPCGGGACQWVKVSDNRFEDQQRKGFFQVFQKLLLPQQAIACVGTDPGCSCSSSEGSACAPAQAGNVQPRMTSCWDNCTGCTQTIGTVECQCAGQCGTANLTARASAPSTAAELCTAGTPSAVSGTGNWSWTCSGNPSDSCTATVAALPPPAGQCGTADGQPRIVAPSTAAELCAVGADSGVIGTGPWSWTCSGVPNANCTASLAAPPPVPALCGTADGSPRASAPSTAAELCTSGVSTAVAGGVAGPWSWSCVGTPNANCTASVAAGASAGCKNTIDFTNGAVGAEQIGACSAPAVGVAIDNGGPGAAVTVNNTQPGYTGTVIARCYDSDPLVGTVAAEWFITSAVCTPVAPTCNWANVGGLTPVPDTSPVCDGTFPFTCDASKSGQTYKCQDAGCGVHSNGMCSDGFNFSCSCGVPVTWLGVCKRKSPATLEDVPCGSFVSRASCLAAPVAANLIKIRCDPQ